MSREGALIRERLAQTERDIAELAGQVEIGEIDQGTASALRERYEAERQALVGRLASDPEDQTDGDPGVLSGTRLLGIGFVMAAVIGLGIWLLAVTGDDTAGVEGVAQDVLTGDAVSLDDVSNEQMEEVVAQNPDITPMRLALAQRYFVDGDFPNSLRHYLYVLDTQRIKDPTALANVGWMTYLSGVPDVAESFIEESLSIEPDGGIAFWYLASVRFYGLNDPSGAVEPLQSLLAYEEVPDEIRGAAEELLAEAEALQ